MNEIDSIESKIGVGNIFVVSGPSGAGKTSLCKALLKGLPGIVGSISYTTRPPREGEEEGKDYYFVDSCIFDRMIHEEAFLEWAEVHGHRYGTVERNVRERHKDLDYVLEVDCKGAAQIKRKVSEAILIFILPRSIEDLIERIRKRGPISERELHRRMETARNEIQQLDFYDYLLFNEEFSGALQELECIIIAERCKRGARKVPWKEKLMNEISLLGYR